MNEETEIWLPVPSRPGVSASSLGRIRLPETSAKMPNGGERRYSTSPTFGVATKASKNARHEYMAVVARKFGNMKVHRLVCEAFHGSPKISSHVVIHLDENPKNNRPSNLRWGTQKENMNMPGYIEYCKSRTGEQSPARKGKARAMEKSNHLANKARADRIAAEYALRDPLRPDPAERQRRHDWYLAQAVAAERGENISQNLAEIA